MMAWSPLSSSARAGRVLLSINYGDDEPLVIGGSYAPIGHPQGLEWKLDNGHRVREEWITAWAPMPVAAAERLIPLADLRVAA